VKSEPTKLGTVIEDLEHGLSPLKRLQVTDDRQTGDS